MTVRIVLVLVGGALVLAGLAMIHHRAAIDHWCGELCAKVGWDPYREGTGTFLWFGLGLAGIGVAWMLGAFLADL